MTTKLQRTFSKKNMTPQQERMLSTILFLLKLMALSFPLYIIMNFSLLLMPLQNAVAMQTEWVLETIGLEASRLGTGLIVNGFSGPFSFVISRDCTAWKSMLFLFALIFAVPSVTTRKRLYGIVIGIPLIWIGNIARITATVLIGLDYGITTAQFVHDVLWQFGLVSLVIGLWVLWWRKLVPYWERDS